MNFNNLYSFKTRQIKCLCAHKKQQAGFVLIIVMILIMLVSGLGLLAVRHARQEAHSTGAYVDSTQAIALAQSAMAVAITDLRKSPDYYQYHFNDASAIVASGDIWHLKYAIKLDSGNFTKEGSVGSTICVVGKVPNVKGCVQILSSPFYDSGGVDGGDDYFSGSQFYTTLTYDAPIVGPCPPGYSCFDDQNYAWYVFGINVIARYGYTDQWTITDDKFIETARAEGKGRVTIGPIGAYGR